MIKSVIKEIGIMLLILFAIALLLIVILYDYNPSNKTIPKQLQEYKISADVEEELDKAVETTTENIVKTYTIDEQDLTIYEKRNEYDRGKVNPFKTSYNTDVAGTNETIGIINKIGK